MKIFIAGGSGRVAKETARLLAQAGHTVYSGSRHPENIETPAKVTAVNLDLHQSVLQLTDQLQGIDAVYFLAGSRGKDLLQTDAFGAVKLMQAAEKAGIQRFIMLSSIFSLEPEKWAGEESLAPIMDYNIAKFFADEWLIHHTNLDYTIVQPSVLTEEKGSGKIELNPDHAGVNPIPDVAAVLVDSLEIPQTIKKVIKMRSGQTPIAAALKAL